MFNGPVLMPKMAPNRSDGTLYHPAARPAFERALWQGRTRGLLARLFGRSRRLFSLEKLVGELPQSIRPDTDVRTIPLKNIKGSINRQREFDKEFYPLDSHLEQRWSRVASMMLQGVELPPVELIQRGDDYYVVDGHHRISVARRLHCDGIDAVIVGKYAQFV